jgi:FkbM family methyltransferase
MNYKSFDITLGNMSRTFFYRPGTSDEGVIQQIYLQRDYDLRRLRRFNELVEYAHSRMSSDLQPLIIDAGANIGASSTYFALSYPASRVVAIEPDPGNFGLLEKNTVGLRVNTICGAVASSSGLMEVIDPGEGFWGLRTVPSSTPSKNSVSAITIESLYKEYCGGHFPFIVKIDIEGGEKDLFSTNTDWVDRTPLIIIELHDWLLPRSRVAKPFLQCIAQHDRDFVQLGENIYSIANW